jgi:hypothetical protein
MLTTFDALTHLLHLGLLLRQRQRWLLLGCFHIVLLLNSSLLSRLEQHALCDVCRQGFDCCPWPRLWYCSRLAVQELQ